jgi:SecD/SecF fusion protein
MQNKGAIRLFAILLALVSLYQLSFTYVTKKVEKEAKESPQGEQAYLDSVKNMPVYNFLFGLRKYTYQECKEREINFGLDLKGGMNLILEVKVSDVIRALSNYNTDPIFQKALKLAEEREKTSNKDFVTLFGEAFQELDPNAQLSTIFNTVALKGQVNYNSTNEEVLAVIRKETQSAIDNAFNILRTRIDKFGVTQPNIQRLEKAGRVLIELPGIKDPQRVRKLLQGTASLEFWETYNNGEVYNYLVKANAETLKIDAATKKSKTVAETGQAKTEEKKTKKSDEDLALLQDLEKDTLNTDSLAAAGAHSLFTYLIPSQNPNGPVVGIAAAKDTAKVNRYLKLPAVKAVLPKDLKFLWTVKPMPS